MASPNAVFTELVTTTFRNHRKTLSDNVSRNNALLSYLKEKKKYRTEDGGTTITTPLEYAENSTYQRYSGFDVLNVAQSDVLTAAEYQWRQIALNIVASGRELRINKGPSRILNLAKSRLRNGMNTYRNQFSNDMYSDGSLANQVNGLQALVSDAGTGTVGGIDASVWAFWRNTVQSAAAPLQGGGAIVPGPTTMESLMLPLYLDLVRGNDQVDLIVSSNDYFSFYEQSQTSIKRYTSDYSSNAGKAAGGFISLKYKTADVIFDGNSGIPTSRMYFLNTDYFEVVAHEDADMTVNDEQSPFNQDAVVIPILWMGNLVCTNRRLQGVVKP
jgi:hypothetical protein